MILRSWVGWTTRERSDDYAAYMRAVALSGYTSVAGNMGVLMLRRPVDNDRAEFVMISLWESMEAVKAFAGEDPSIARFYDRDNDFLVDREWTVSHYEVFGRSDTLGPDFQR